MWGGLVPTFSLKMKARTPAASSTRKMIRMSRKNCRNREAALSPQHRREGTEWPLSEAPVCLLCSWHGTLNT